jgi:hypothetical protein
VRVEEYASNWNFGREYVLLAPVRKMNGGRRRENKKERSPNNVSRSKNDNRKRDDERPH